MYLKLERFPFLLGGLAAGLSCFVGQGCGSGQLAGTAEEEPVSSTQSAVVVTPPGTLAGNSNYWITAADPSGNTGLPITGFNVSIAVREDLSIPNGMSIQLNGWSAPDSTVTWQQYGFSVTPPTLGWGIENWPTDALRAQLGLPAGGSLNFPGSLAAPLPNFPYGKGIVPAGYILDLVFHDDAKGNITGMTYTVTDICGKKSSLGPINIVGTSLQASGASGTIPESALAPMYGVQLNLVNMPGGPFQINSGSGTITYSANEPLFVSNHQPSWTSAQGIVTAENSPVAYSELSSGPSKIIVQDFGISQCQCSGTTCELPPGSFSGSCSGCTSSPSGSGCQVRCDSCGTLNGTPKQNSTLQVPCTGALTNGAVSNNNGDLSLQCTFQPPAGGGVKTNIDPQCAAGACVTPQGPYLTSCTGCAAVSSGADCALGCTSCTKTDGTENAAPNLALPCSKAIQNNNGVLTCGEVASGSGGATGQSGSAGQGGSVSGQGGAFAGQAGSPSTGGASGNAGGGGRSLAGSSGAAASGGGSSKAGSSSSDSSSSSGCSCKLAARRTGSTTQALALLALAGLLSVNRRRSRSNARNHHTR